MERGENDASIWNGWRRKWWPDWCGTLPRCVVGWTAPIIGRLFSRDWEKNVQQGQVWGVDQQRIYANAFEMAEREAARGDGIDFVVIATPNESHYAIACSFLEKGIHVFCEKPLTNVSEQACELTALGTAHRDLAGSELYIFRVSDDSTGACDG